LGGDRAHESKVLSEQACAAHNRSTSPSVTEKKEKQEPASPSGKDVKTELVAPPSPAKFTGTVTSKKRLFDGDRKTPIAKKTPGTAKLSAALMNAKAVVTAKDRNFASAGHRFQSDCHAYVISLRSVRLPDRSERLSQQIAKRADGGRQVHLL
jgi:hypothetical protein